MAESINNGKNKAWDTRNEKIEGLRTSETCPLPQFMGEVEAATKALKIENDVLGEFCNVNIYINAPVEDVYNYAADIHSLEEWTFSMRNLQPIAGKKGLFKATELLAPSTEIWAKVDAYPDAKVVDYLCAWDQGNELWMRYYMRFIDAMPTIGKPGTIVMWLNCRHPFYTRNLPSHPQYIQEAQARKDRPWVGDFWPMFKAGHDFEAQNLKLIAEHRFGKKAQRNK